MAESMNLPARISAILRGHSTALLVAACSALFLQDVFSAHGLLAMNRSRREAAEIRLEIQRLNLENQRLADRVQSLKSDPSAIECIAREEIGLARPGEFVFKLQPNSASPDDPCANTAPPPANSAPQPPASPAPARNSP
jgi:cell division protein FtsB